MLFKINANFCIIFYSILSITSAQIATTPAVSTENGAVIGLETTVDNTTVNVFKGIPFAKPPVGVLRFRKTEPALNRNATLTATSYGPACMQPGVPGVTVSSLSEDCLYLNVWTPTLNTSANLPVMVWIYGGAFIFGAGNQGPLIINVYDMSYLAQRNVVVVSFNYRVGVFGFLYGNSSEAPGNAGLWDQVMALNWTRRNIANFGGNPYDITLFGESVGSISLSNLIVSNAAFGIRDWFNKAILLSGTGYVEFLTQNSEYAYKFARNYSRNAFIDPQCNNDNAWINCLKNKTALELLASELANYLKNGNNYIPGVLQFTPIYRDVFSLIPYSPNTAVKLGYFRQDLRILMNHNEMEGVLFTTILDTIEFIDGRYAYYVPYPLPFTKSIVTNDVLNSLLKNYPLFKQPVVNAYVTPFTDLQVILNPQPIRRSVAYAAGDYGLACPTVLFGASIAKWPEFTGIVYQSRFTYQSPISPFSATIWSNTTHAEDLLFLFGQPLNYPVFNSNDKLISNKMMDLITHFAKTGDVLLLNPTQYSSWPPYSSVSDGSVNASYVELNPDHTRLGRVYTDRYRGNDGYFPKDIYNCFILGPILSLRSYNS